MRPSLLIVFLTLLEALGAPAHAGWSPFQPGVDYFNDVLPGPRRVFGLRVNLCHPGVRMRATTSGERGKRTSTWASNTGVVAAINGGYFKAGYGPDAGTAKGGGALWPDATESAVRGWFGFGRHGVDHSPADEIRVPADWIEEAVNGDATLVSGGVAVNCGGCGGGARAPRSAVGITADRRTVYLMVVDGRSNASIGMTIDELAVFMAGFGVDRAMNLDGGGSSTLWVNNAGVRNTPSDGTERIVGNHLGVFAPGDGLTHHCPTGYGAEYVGGGFWGGAAVFLEPGDVGSGYLDFRNIGSEPWSVDMTRLAPTPRDQPSPFAAPDWLAAHRIIGPAGPVAPGEVGRFVFSVTAPTTVGTHRLYLDMVHELVTWFSSSWGPTTNTFFLTVEVVPRPSLRGRIESVSLAGGPASATVEVGQTVTAKVVVTNTGENTWAPGQVRLGTSGPRDHAGVLLDPSWLSVNRVAANPGEVARGQQATFEFLVRAPNAPGEYRETFGLLIDGQAWFGDVGGPPDDTIALTVTAVEPPPDPGPEPEVEPAPEVTDEGTNAEVMPDSTVVETAEGVEPTDVETSEVEPTVEVEGGVEQVAETSWADTENTVEPGPENSEVERTTVVATRDDGCLGGGASLLGLLGLGWARWVSRRAQRSMGSNSPR